LKVGQGPNEGCSAKRKKKKKLDYNTRCEEMISRKKLDLEERIILKQI
jgi:hypothetical protein